MDFIYFLGRFHVLVLHVPISLLLVAALADALSRRPRFRYLHAALPFLWGTAALSAVLTVVLGYMHFAEGGFEGRDGDAHRLFGTSLAAVSLVVWFLAVRARVFYLRLRTPLILIVIALVAVTGHFGGNLTHGASYLFGASAAPPSAQPVSAGPDPLLVQSLIGAGFTVRAVSQTDPRLVVHADFAAGATDAQLDALSAAGEAIVDLSLPRSALDDADLARIASALTALIRLRIDNNALSDEGVASLAGLTELRSLNLYGNTAITDASIDTLTTLPALTQVYVWGTGIGAAGLARLRAERRQLGVHSGIDAAERGD
jgi:hypothetical protein